MKENKQQALFDAALKLFAHYGFKKTTVEDVAAVMGMTKSNIYFYVNNKKDLYEKAVAFALTRWRDTVAAAVEREKDAAAKFVVMARTSFDYIESRQDLQAILIQDPGIFTLSSREDRFYEINQGAMQLVRSILEQGVGEGTFHAVDIDHATEFLFSVYIMFLIKTYVKSERSTIAGIYGEGLGMILRGLCKDTPALNAILTGAGRTSGIFRNHS
ncbi:MAG: TetR/AcrR family transcriptional regulator [Thermodesulfobacteriota bacterium]